MGKPAARIGDMTAHAGTITVGYPTVLIGGVPAARIGDMHVCPMLTPGTPPIPHVGGPISLGSPTVFIGGMPAARVGDMLVCVGPPDTVVMGCMTVLIGEAGGGAGGGGGGGEGGAAAAQVSAATALTDNVESTTKEEHWIEFEFVDKAGNLISGVPYKFTDTNSKDSSSKIRLDGKIRRDALKEGEAKVQLYNVSNAKWSKEKANVGEKVKMTADVEGFEDGTVATIEIYKRDLKVADVVFNTIETKVKNSKVEEEWEYILSDEQDEQEKTPKSKQEYSAPQYYFEVVVEMCKARSGLLKFKDWIEIELKDEEGNPIANEEYFLYLSNGEVREGNLDRKGYKKEEKIPPGNCFVKFPKLLDEKTTD